jgi:hypothetical protein
MGLGGQEETIEVPVAVDTADDTRDRDTANASVHGSAEVQLLSDFVEGQQLARAAQDRRPNDMEERPKASSPEIGR